jgi:PAS domain S-box-containing protein
MAGGEDLREAGILAVQTTPLVSRSGALLGMVSTHWREPHELSVSELRALDILIRLAADVLERSQADRNLRDALQDLKIVTENMAAGVTRCSHDLRYLWVSPSLAAWLGRAPAEFVGLPILDVIGREAYDTILPHITRVLSGEREEYEAQINYLGQGPRWIHAVYVPTKDQDDKVDGWIAVVTDITKRHEAEERMRAREHQLNDAQRLAMVGSWERPINAEGTPYWSDEMLRIVGLPKGSSEDFDTFMSYVHPRDREKVLEGVCQIQLTTAPINLEYRLIRPDGAVRFVRSIAEGIRDSKGVVSRIIGATQDITEQVKAREVLRESEERFRRVFEEGPLGMALQGPNHRFLKVNNALCQMIGYSEAALLQMSFIDITHLDDVQADVELADRLFRREIPVYRMQKRYVKNNGDIIWVNLTKSVIADDDDEPLYGLTMVEDITEAKRTQEEALARHKLESVGTLASGIAHDFNNLLGGVLAQAELALAELAAGLHPEEELRAIRNVAIRGSEIVRQLMIYAGKESAVLGLIDVSQIVREMLELLRVLVSKHVTLETDLGQDLPPVWTNAAQIRQIVINLITNASEAIGERDGVIRLTTRRMKGGRDSSVAISERLADDDYLQLEVTDTGCGMSPETRARVFDPFFTTKSAGHGLGLAVVDGIVRSLGGIIDIASEPGKGTTFQVSLPSDETKAWATNDTPSGDEESARPTQECTVLVVEDEVPLRQAVVKILRNAGFVVLEANDGSAAIDLLRANVERINLILLDLTIPGASSAQVVAEAAQTRPDIRVILTSAYSQEMVTAPLSAPQISGFIRKPFHLEELVKALHYASSAS